MYVTPKRYLAVAIIGIVAAFRLVPAAAAQEPATEASKQQEALKAQKDKLALEVEIAELNNKLVDAKKHRTGNAGDNPEGRTDDVARVETFIGLEYLRVNPQPGISALVAKGVKGELILNFTNTLAVVTEMGANQDAHLASFAGDPSSYEALIGPRLTSRRFGRLTPYIQANIGGVFTKGDRAVAAALPVTGATGVAGTSRIAKAALASSAGVGLDIRVMHWISIRPLALDYFMTRIDQLREPTDRQQNGFRYSAGATVRWGRR